MLALVQGKNAPIATTLLQAKIKILTALPAVLPTYPLATTQDLTGTTDNVNRPKGYAFVVIAVNQGKQFVPYEVAQIGGGDAGAYATTMATLNPQFGGNWANANPDDTVNVPWDWAPKLKAAGYIIHQDDGAGPTSGSVTSGVFLPSFDVGGHYHMPYPNAVLGAMATRCREVRNAAGVTVSCAKTGAAFHAKERAPRCPGCSGPVTRVN